MPENNEMGVKLDFDVLDSINIPKIEDVIESSKPIAVSKKDEEVDEFEIKEVESIDHFGNFDDDDSNDTNKKPITPSDDSDNSNNEDPVKQIAQWQSELGILDFEEEEYTKAEDKEEFFKQKFFDKVKKTADESLHPVIRELNEKFREGVPLDELIASKSNEIRFESIDDETLTKDETLQEQLVAEMLRSNNWTEDEIKDEIETYKDANKLHVRAKSALGKLIEYEKTVQTQLEKQAKDDQKAREAQYNKSMEDVKNKIYNTETFIEGVTMSKEDKEKLFYSVTKRDKDNLTLLEKKLIEKPELQFAFAQFVLQLDGKFDAIKNSIKSETTKKLKNDVNTYKDTNKKTKLDLSVAREAINRSKRTY